MRNGIVILLILWGGLFEGFAQEYPIQKYTIHQGLPTMAVYDVCKDSRGIVWTATSAGLSRFNGETFTNYTVADGLPTNHVDMVQEDSNGYIWALCGRKGMARFDGKTFKTYLFPKGTENTGFTTDNSGNVFLAINLKLYIVSKDTIIPFKLKNRPKNVIDVVQNIDYFSKTNGLIINTGGKIYHYKAGNWQEIMIPSVRIAGVRVSFDDEVIIETINPIGEVVYYSWNGITSKPFLKIKNDTFEVFNAINHDFVFPAGKGLFFIRKKQLKTDFISDNPPIAFSLNYLKQPDGATLWLPTEKGLWQLTRRGFQQFSAEQVPYCWGVIEDKNNNYYFLNYDISLQKYDGQHLTTIPTKVYEDAVPPAMKQLGMRINAWYYKPLKDKYGHIWLPNVHGVFHYDYEKWQFYTHNHGQPLAFCLAEDSQRDKIIACSNEQLYTIQSKVPHTFEFIKDTTRMFGSGSLLTSVVVAPNHEYWFSGRGIGNYNPDTKRFKYYNFDNHKIATKGILGLYFDWQNTLWAMSWEGGLFRFNPNKDIFERVLEKYLNGVISSVEQIDPEHLLIGSPQGLYVLNLKVFNQQGEVELKVFNHQNGFMGLECGQLGTFRDSKGDIWITSGSVLTRMTPQELDFNKSPLKTFIVKVGNQTIPFTGNKEIIDLPRGQNSTSFTVESIGEDKPFRSQFSFRIKGFLNNWSDWQEQNLIMINNIPNGIHTIEVRSRTGTFETCDSSMVKLQFCVSVPFYKSPNFFKYAALIGLILTLSMGYFWWRERTQKQRVSTQEKLIKEQENKVRFLQIQTIQAQMNPHFTFNVLGTLQHLILNNDTQKASENLLKLSSLIRNYLEASLLGDDQMGSLFKHEIILLREIDLLKMYVEFEQLQYTDRFDFEITLDGKLNPNNYRVPPLIIQPFVENAIKHGLLYKPHNENGKLWIHFLSLNEDTLICTVEDSGVGRIRAAEMQQISFKKYKSRGTELVKRRVEILNEMGYDIEIKTDDRLSGGTVVTIKIGYK